MKFAKLNIELYANIRQKIKVRNYFLRITSFKKTVYSTYFSKRVVNDELIKDAIV